MDNDKWTGCLVGLACGDAVGAPVEFLPRGRFKPLTDMVSGGTEKIRKGQWTDDTSMALCIAVSLLEQKGFDAKDQMDRYLRWGDTGYLSSKPYAFGIGMTVASALAKYRRSGDPYAGSIAPNTAGNGSIMRLAPIPMMYFRDLEQTIEYARRSSMTTHATEACTFACEYFAVLLRHALLNQQSKTDLFALMETVQLPAVLQCISEQLFRSKSRDEIKGSGYVVESLEAALWCFWHTDNFRDAILAAANLGDDADTTAAICGQLAGAFYGQSGIPADWVNAIYHSQFIQETACALKDQLADS